jgi:hypothetical protein
MHDEEQMVYDVQINTSKLNLKSRENSFLGQMTRLEEECIEEIKITTAEKVVNPSIQDVIFLSGVGFKTVRSSVERERSKHSANEAPPQLPLKQVNAGQMSNPRSIKKEKECGASPNSYRDLV